MLQIFIVRKSSRDDIMALSVQFPDGAGAANIDHYLIEPATGGVHLQGSTRLFPAIPNLIAYYCDHKWVYTHIQVFLFVWLFSVFLGDKQRAALSHIEISMNFCLLPCLWRKWMHIFSQSKHFWSVSLLLLL